MTRRTKIDGAVLTLGEMAYVLNHAGLSWAIIRWVFGYTYNRSAQSTARKTAEWGGLPWINGRSPSQSQREMLTGWTRSHPEGRRVTHGRTLAEIALSLIESGLIKIVLDGNRTEGCRAYLLRTMGCSWPTVARIMGRDRPNTVIVIARKFGKRTPDLPMTAVVVVKSVTERGKRIYEYGRTHENLTWRKVAEAFRMSESGVRHSAEAYVTEYNEQNPGAPLPWPLWEPRKLPGRTSYMQYPISGTWGSTAKDLGYAQPSSARDVALHWWEGEGKAEGWSWPPSLEQATSEAA